MTTPAFNPTDSFALWRVPDGVSEKAALAGTVDAAAPYKDQDATLLAFKAAYRPGFPMTDLPSDFPAYFQRHPYVFLGMNPGDNPTGEAMVFPQNFHGGLRSNDVAFAAAAYGTGAWGAFMTDISAYVTSDSNDTELSTRLRDEATFTALFAHLKAIGVPDDATLIAFSGPNTPRFKKLQKLAPASYRIARIYHYSAANRGRWDTNTIRQELLALCGPARA